MLTMKPKPRTFPKQRRSASAALALQAEIERVKNMTMLERVQLALSLRSQHPWLAKDPPPNDTHGTGN